MSEQRAVPISQDLLSGLLVIGLGAAGLYFGRGYPLGSATDMGPGYLPRVVALALIALGAILALRGVFSIRQRIARVPLRSTVLILGSMLLFAVLIDRAGMALSCVATFLVCAFASPEVRWKEVLILAVVLAAFTVGVFVYGLGQPIPIWPR